MLALWVQALLFAVALESPAPSPELSELAVSSCSHALADGRCVPIEEADLAAEPDALVAVAVWNPDWLAARLTIRRARGGEPLAVRSVLFTRADPLEERFRALGLIVASYATVHGLDSAETPREPPAPSVPEAPPPTRDTAPAPRRSALVKSLDLALFAGPALDRGGARAGLLARARLAPSESALAWIGTLRGALRSGEPRFMWAAASTGASLRLGRLHAPVALEARAELVGQRTQVRARDALGTGARGGAFRWGGQLGAELVFCIASDAGLFVGGEWAHLRPRVRVSVEGQEVGVERQDSWSVLGGARISWE